jgi:hypothetical protein
MLETANWVSSQQFFQAITAAAAPAKLRRYGGGA